MQEMLIQPEFWLELECSISSRVSAALNAGEIQREPLIVYLRNAEIMARTSCDRRQTIQIIASGRSILGDRKVLGPHDGPFAHA